MSNNRLSKNFVKDREIIDEVKRKKFKSKSAERLSKLKIPKPIQPAEEIIEDFPKDITEVPKADLGRYLGVYEAESSWIGFCIAEKEIEQEHAKALLNYVYHRLHNKAPGKATDKKSKVLADKFYTKCLLETNTLEADVKLLKASLVAYQSYSKAISREISNREEKPYEHRQSHSGLPDTKLHKKKKVKGKKKSAKSKR